MNIPEKSNTNYSEENQFLRNELDKKSLELNAALEREKQFEFLFKERTKELNCLNEISKIFSSMQLQIDEILEQILQTIPPAMQFPEMAEVFISANGKNYKTNGYSDSELLIQQPILVKEEQRGFIKICYPDNKFNGGQDIFLAEERNLLFTIAARISGILTIKEEEKKAAESTRLYQSFMKASPDVLIITDLSGIVEYASPAAFSIFKLNQDPVGKHLLEFIAPTDLNKAQEGIAEMFRGMFFGPIEYKGIRPDGSLFWIEVSGEFIRNSVGEPEKMIFITRDSTQRKIIEETLKKSEERFRQLVENINDAIYEISSEAIIKYVSPSIEKVVGYKPEELIGRNFFDFMYPDDIPILLNALQNLGNLDYSHLEYRYIAKNGEIRWVRSSTTPIIDEGVIMGGIGSLTNITESKNYELELKRREFQHNETQKLAKLGHWEFDFPSNKLIWSEEAYRIFDLDPLAFEPTYDNFLDAIHPDDREFVNNAFKNSLENRVPYDIVHRLLMKNGDVKYVNERCITEFDDLGKPLKSIGTMMDITRQYLTEQELRIFKYATDAATYGIAINKLDGEIIYVNKAWADMHGYEFNELIGKNLSIGHNQEQLAEVGRLVEKLFANGKIYSEELYHVRKDGTVFPTLMNATVITDVNNQPHFISGSAIDISDLKHAQHDLEKSELRYRSIFENIQDVYYETNLDSTLREISPSVTQLSKGQYTREELIGQPVKDIYESSVEREQLFEYMHRDGKINDYEINLKNKDGSVIPVSITAKLMVDKNGNPEKIIGTIRDISERISTNKILKLNEEKLNKAQEIAQMGSWEFIPETGDIFWSKNYYNLIGIDPENGPLKLDEIKKRIHVEDKNLFESTIQKIIETHTTNSISFRLIKPNEGIKWIESVLSPVFEGDKLLKIDGISIDITDKKNYEIEIEHQKDQLQAIIKAMPDIMFVIDRDGNYLEYYTSDEQLLMVPRDHIVGNNLQNFFPPEDAAKHLLNIQECLQKKTITEYEYSLNFTGVIQFFEARLVPMQNFTVLCFIREITQRKQNELAVRKLSQAVEQSPVMTIITDVKGNIEYVNEVFVKITGYSQKDVLGKNPRILKSGKTDQNMYNELWKTILKGKNWSGEWVNRKKNGELYWEFASISPITNTEGKIVNFLAVKQDITQRKQIEDELLELNQNLETKVEHRTKELADKTRELENFFNVSLDLLCIADTNGNFLKVNKAWEDILGYPVQELENHKFLDFVHPDDLDTTLQAMKKLDKQLVVFDFINRYRTKENTYKYIEWHSVPVGKTIYAAARDITESYLNTDFQHQLLQVATKLAGIPYTEIKFSINRALQQIGQFLHSDRAYIFEFNNDSGTMNNTYEWCNEDVNAEIENLQEVPIDIFPEWMKKLKSNEEILIPSVKDLPESWIAEREILEPQGIKSLIVIPLLSEKTLIGFAGLDYVKNQRDFKPYEINIMRLWGTMLAGLINNYKVELQLEETRQNFQTFFNTIDDFLFVLDENGNMIYTNETVKRRLGYTDQELIGKSVLTVHPENRREEAGRIVMEMLEGKAETCPVPLVNKWGQKIEVETRVKKGFWDGKSVIFGVTKDITQIRLSEQKFSSAFHSSSAVMTITRFTDGIFVDVNNEFINILGFQKEETIGHTLITLGIVREKDAESNIKSAINSGKSVREVEVNAFSKSGKKHIFLISAEEIYIGMERCILSVAVDITGRKFAEEQLQWNKSLLEMMSNSSPMGFLVVDNRTDDILYFNKRFCQIWGIEHLEEPMKKGQIKNNDIIPYCIAVLSDAKAFADSCKPLQDENNRLVISDEIPFINNRTIHRYSTQIRGSDDKYFGRFYIFEDVTEEIKAKQELISARYEAETANKAKSEFLSRMSHELRTPMNSILGFAQLLEMGELNSRQKNGVNHILQSGKYLLNMINEILELSRIESGRLSLSIEPVSVNMSVHEIIDFLKPLSEQKNIQITNYLKTTEIFVNADKQKLKQILLNLLSNAIKYNYEGGLIEIYSEQIKKNSDEKEFVRINIKDTGFGIAEENAGKLFSPFERIGAESTNIEGTGLGLAVSKKLIEAMQGSIGVESKKGKGSRFWIELPLISCLETKVIEKEDLQKSFDLNNEITGKILYFEDNKSNIELISEILFLNRPLVQFFSENNGNNALEKIRKVMPDLILLDLNLPGVQGDNILKEILLTPGLQNIPVVMISADATPQQIRSLKKIGASNYLTKPVNISQLLKTIDKHLNR